MFSRSLAHMHIVFLFLLWYWVTIVRSADCTADTAKLTSPRTLADKRWVGPVKLLCIIIFYISKIRPKSILRPVKAQKFSQESGTVVLMVTMKIMCLSTGRNFLQLANLLVLVACGFFWANCDPCSSRFGKNAVARRLFKFWELMSSRLDSQRVEVSLLGLVVLQAWTWWCQDPQHQCHQGLGVA